MDAFLKCAQFFLIWIKCQKQIHIRGYSIFTCLSWLPKCPFAFFSLYWGKECFSKNIFIEFFYVKYFLNFSSFFLWNVFITYFIHLFYNAQSIMAYMLKIWMLIIKTINQIDMHIFCWEKVFYEILDYKSKGITLNGTM